MFLCFITPLVVNNEIRVINSTGLTFKLLDRMGLLCDVDPVDILRPQYRPNPIVVAAMRSAIPVIFPNRWRRPPDNANSLDWWNVAWRDGFICCKIAYFIDETSAWDGFNWF